MNKIYGSLNEVWQHAQDIASLPTQKIKETPMSSHMVIGIWRILHQKRNITICRFLLRQKNYGKEYQRVYDLFLPQKCPCQNIHECICGFYGFNVLFQYNYTAIQSIIIH